MEKNCPIMNRYYSWKLQFIHVNASNLYKITVTHVLGGNISLPNKIPLVLPFEGFFTSDKTNNKFFFIIVPPHLKYQRCYY